MDGYGQVFDRGFCELVLEIGGGREGFAGDVAGGEGQGEVGFGEGVGGEAEGAVALWLDLDFALGAVCFAHGVEEGGGGGVVDAGEEGEVVGGLEEAEVVWI